MKITQQFILFVFPPSHSHKNNEQIKRKKEEKNSVYFPAIFSLYRTKGIS